MKQLFTLFLLITIFFSSNAQKEVLLKLNHKIDDQQLILNTGKYNAWNEVPYYLTRFQYYFTRILITHASGNAPSAYAVYLLVDPLTGTYSLGNYDLENIEALDFYIGVDSKLNHKDPTIWPAGHPLAPQNPDMNWGWVAGYRFTAIEGFADTGNGLYTDNFQFHAIGDILFTKVHVDVNSTTDINGKVVIEMDANYNKLFSTLELTGGQVYHGEQNPNKILMSNFKDVFTAASTTATHNINNDLSVNYSNPSSSKNIEYNGKLNDINFDIHNIYGQKVYSVGHLPAAGIVPITTYLENGLYIISFSKDTKVIFTNKLIIQD